MGSATIVITKENLSWRIYKQTPDTIPTTKKGAIEWHRIQIHANRFPSLTKKIMKKL